MNDTATTKQVLYPINCDQVAWLNDALERFAYTLKISDRGISRLPKAAQLAALIEIMEICGLCFADETAKANALARFHELRDWTMKRSPKDKALPIPGGKP